MSRELDAAVAEEVMAQKVETNDRGEWMLLTPMTVPGWADHVSELPHYSTDIAAAWQVVEKIRGRGLGIFLVDPTHEMQNVETGEWGGPKGPACAFIDGAFTEDITCVAGVTVPEAICRAALKAVRGK
jgi:hypothetical protein